jgi:hypothetical protein
LVEHTTENRGVGSSILPLATERIGIVDTGRADEPARLDARSSIGRAPVSKTGGWGFDPLRACETERARKPGCREGRRPVCATRQDNKREAPIV